MAGRLTMSLSVPLVRTDGRWGAWRVKDLPPARVCPGLSPLENYGALGKLSGTNI